MPLLPCWILITLPSQGVSLQKLKHFATANNWLLAATSPPPLSLQPATRNAKAHQHSAQWHSAHKKAARQGVAGRGEGKGARRVSWLPSMYYVSFCVYTLLQGKTIAQDKLQEQDTQLMKSYHLANLPLLLPHCPFSLSLLQAVTPRRLPE